MENPFFRDPHIEEAAYSAWKILKDRKLKNDEIERVIAFLYQKQYHLSLKEMGGLHKTGKLCKHVEDNIGQAFVPFPISDHAGVLKKDGKTVAAVFEPYSLNKEHFRQLIDECDKRNIGFSVDGESQHFAGRSFRIFIPKS